MGFTDCGDKEREERQAQYTEKLLRIAAELPYVRTVHNFRLLTETGMFQKAGIENNQIGGLAEVYFGFFTEPSDGCRSRQKSAAVSESINFSEKETAISKAMNFSRIGGEQNE